jgi:hypothetical protein
MAGYEDLFNVSVLVYIYVRHRNSIIPIGQIQFIKPHTLPHGRQLKPSREASFFALIPRLNVIYSLVSALPLRCRRGHFHRCLCSWCTLPICHIQFLPSRNSTSAESQRSIALGWTQTSCRSGTIRFSLNSKTNF